MIFGNYAEGDGMVIMQRNPSYNMLDDLGRSERETSGTYVSVDDGADQTTGAYVLVHKTAFTQLCVVCAIFSIVPVAGCLGVSKLHQAFT